MKVAVFEHNSKVAKNEPKWGDVDKTKLPAKAFARLEQNPSAWAFPHHWVKNGKDTNGDGIYNTGTLYLHTGGLDAAWSAAMGGRSGKKAEPFVIAHLRKHFADLGIKKSEFVEIDGELIAGGFLTLEELLPNWEARLRYLIGGE